MSAARRGGLLLALAIAGAAFTAAPAARAAVTVDGLALPDTGVFAPVAARWNAGLAALEGTTGAARVEALLAIGRVDQAGMLARQLEGSAPDSRLARVRADLARDGVLGAEDARGLGDPAAPDGVRRLWFADRFGHDDPAAVDSATAGISLLPGTDARLPDLLAAGRLSFDVMRHARAESCYTRALERADRDDVTWARVSARNGLALVAQRRRDWDGALARSTEGLAIGTSSDALETLAQSLIRLGRTGEAIGAARWAAALDPWAAQGEAAFDPSHGTPHYLLGNGYARLDYTQLRLAYPQAFADAAGQRALATGDQRWTRGDRRGARDAYRRVVAAHPGWADARLRLASLDFEEERHDEAVAGGFAALRLCPEYGRAHALLSRALDARRFLVDVHRAGYERRFAAAPMPAVPGIDRFVLDWKALSPRHQKRVVLSIAPWKAYLPVLLEGGATFYIKPMSMRLSECPDQQALKDQRIDYDSRLWDDVRGCGGYHTVTGVEDVERTIFDRYDTVLHELAHQVHGVLPADDQRVILERYRAAKTRDEATKDAFLSRYAGGSVHEYLAEGANALASPKRDVYDPREIVRERLDARDPALRVLVERLIARTDVSACFPVAFVNAGDDRIERGRVDQALPFYRKALARSPGEESAHGALVSALTLANRGAEALAAAGRAVRMQPSSGAVRVAAARAAWHGGRGLDSAIAGLRASRAAVRDADHAALDRALGWLLWTRGEAMLAAAAFDSALARQSDDPDALHGKAASLALAQRWDDAFMLYERAVRSRTGNADLRRDLARDLIRARRLDEARAQLDAVQLLDPVDPDAEALRGWLALSEGAPDSARAHARRALAMAPWCDLARAVLGSAALQLRDTTASQQAIAPLMWRIEHGAPPEYVYRPARSTWEEVHTLPAVERELLESTEIE